MSVLAFFITPHGKQPKEQAVSRSTGTSRQGDPPGMRGRSHQHSDDPGGPHTQGVQGPAPSAASLFVTAWLGVWGGRGTCSVSLVWRTLQTVAVNCIPIIRQQEQGTEDGEAGSAPVKGACKVEDAPPPGTSPTPRLGALSLLVGGGGGRALVSGQLWARGSSPH